VTEGVHVPRNVGRFTRGEMEDALEKRSFKTAVLGLAKCTLDSPTE